jgi:hypothetical protein
VIDLRHGLEQALAVIRRHALQQKSIGSNRFKELRRCAQALQQGRIGVGGRRCGNIQGFDP